jgi:hypothetical protein
MSNHFTYEIDERNLRLQLKEHEVPAKEDTWQKFEAFSDALPCSPSHRGMSFNFNLNRNVILPAVFGVIIILFSFLLVNFISIKVADKKSGNAKTEIKSAAAPMSLLSEEKNKSVSKSTPEIKNAEQPKVEASQVADEKTTPLNPVQIQTIPENTQQVATTAIANTETAGEVKTETAVKKKRKRRSAEVIEEQQLQEVRPTLVTDDRETEDVRPN